MRILLASLIGVCISITAFAQNTGIETTACFLDDCSTIPEQHVQFGYLNVPEDYDRPDGKQIRVPYAVIKSQAENPEPDPVLIFQGGTGIPILNTLSYYYTTFPIKNRDIILYDYRGTGYSSPALCPELGASYYALLEEDYSYKQFTDELNRLNDVCLEDIRNQGIELKNYSMGPKTRDAVYLAEHLGYKEVNLYGFSNGTAAIQSFLREVENSNLQIRSILSDSNVPMAYYPQAEMPLDYKSSLHKVLNDCANDPECAETYPDLENRFQRFLQKTIDEPLVYEGDRMFTLNYYEINGIIHRLLYFKAIHKDIPLLLELFMEGNIDFFSRLDVFFRNVVSEMNGTSVINYTYDWNLGKKKISEDYKRVLETDPEYMLTNFWLGFYLKDNPVGYNSMDSVPVRHDAPALVLAGSYDPVTPPAMSRIMHERYRNSYYFELPKTGHGAVSTPCGESLFKQFIENPGSKPDGDCVEAMASEKIPFTLSIYHNQKVNKLATSVIQQRNIVWILIVAIPFIFSIIVLIREIGRALRKQGLHPLHLALSLLTLIFIIALGYYLRSAASAGGITIIFGLVSSAWWLPWVVLCILILAGALMVKILRKASFNFWNAGLLVSSGLILFLAFTYEIFPF